MYVYDEICIKDGVTSIPDKAFSTNEDIYRIGIAASVTSIGTNAFGMSAVNNNITIDVILHGDAPANVKSVFAKNSCTITFNGAWNNAERQAFAPKALWQHKNKKLGQWFRMVL